MLHLDDPRNWHGIICFVLHILSHVIECDTYEQITGKQDGKNDTDFQMFTPVNFRAFLMEFRITLVIHLNSLANSVSGAF